MNEIISSVLNSAKEIKEEMITCRRELHQHPEVGDHLNWTTQFVMNKLKEYGYEPTCICESGIVACIHGNKPGKTFLLRADMDALPVTEQSKVTFKSTNGNMHACGHDMHTTMLLGAAKLLKKYQGDIEGTIKLVFQPNEEGFRGAKAMIQAGVLKNPEVDAAMAMHVNSGTPTNVILYGLGTSIAGCTIFRINVKGTGCHGAMPENGVDPINIAAHIYLSIQEITVREISAAQSIVITFGKFVGGETHNVIPDEVVMEGTIRYLSRDIGEFAFNRMRDIVTSTGQMFRGEATIEEVESVPPLVNNTELANEIGDYFKDIVGENSVISFNNGGMGSEDFASFTYEVPSVYFLLGAGVKDENPAYGYPMHHPCVTFNEDILPTGAAMHTIGAIQWLKNHHG